MDKLTTMANAYAKYRALDSSKFVTEDGGVGPYSHVNDMEVDEYNLAMADICAEHERIEQAHAQLLEHVSENLWRLQAWSNTELRCALSPFRVAILLAEGGETGSGKHVEALKELITTDVNKVALLAGNQGDLDIRHAIEQFCPICGDPNISQLHGDFLIQNLLGSIPKSALPMYPKNPYQAARKVLQTLYPESFKGLEENASKFNANTEAVNIDAMSAQLPTFTSLAKDKVEAWKQVTITPTVAKIKMACGRDLSDSEAKAILIELQRTLQGASFVDPKGVYRIDASSRAYYQTIQPQSQPQPKTQQQQSSRPRKRLTLKKAVIVSGICALLLWMGVPGWYVAIGAVLVLIMF